MEVYKAVNKMLRYIGEMPIPSSIAIDDLEVSHEAYIARDILLEVSEEIQANGYWFNTETQFLVPDYNGEIAIPDNVISVEGLSDNVVQKDKQLYDLDNTTFKFTQEVECEIVYNIDFDVLPRLIATYIIYKATESFQTVMNGDEIIDRKLLKLVNESYLLVDKEQMSKSNYNLIKGSRLLDRNSNPTPLS